ncbi:hypothetical protein Clacol_008457 [Clathrus columnatus]|uniref:Uncharacterized protein n=1 Tax=Clathrus columnatus TaxID=1419009 RepID=A0AAV5AMY8_9AGAM|nr:hypothetical protein Clacol_008457 [Clathrus columnatus]
MEYNSLLDRHQFESYSLEDPFYLEPLTFKNDQELFTAIDQFYDTLPASWLKEPDVSTINLESLNRHPNYPGYVEATPVLEFTRVQHTMGVGYSNHDVRSRRLYPNSYEQLQGNHMENGMETFFVPQDYVMQQSQELGISPILSCNQSTRGTISSIPTAVVPHEFLTDVSPSSTGSSFPTTPEDQPCTSHQTSISSRVKSQLQLSKKPGRRTKKASDTPPNLIQKKRSRKFPNGRAQVQSQFWLDECFSQGICQICKGGARRKRCDRLLEHLVSSHFIQPIKNLEVFDEEELAIEAVTRPHFIKTQAQFEYTREYINSVRCALCPGDTSLVFRNFEQHLNTKHAEEASRDMEMDRLESLVPEKRHWYDIHDRFLYNFPAA